MKNFIKLAWKVYGLPGQKQEEALMPSFSTDMDTLDNPWKREIRLEVYNSDLTGSTDYCIISITGPNLYACEEELRGQLSDGIFEGYAVGNVEPLKELKIPINREPLEQGMGYKNEGAFYDKHDPNRICYLAELSDTIYSRNDFLKLADYNPKIAERIFSYCDWQAPETALEDLLGSQEIVECPKCKHLLFLGDDEDAKCSHCGTAVHVNLPY